MIRLSELMTAVQKAAEQAARAVTEENVRTLRSYFHSHDPEKTSPDGETPASLDELEQLTPRMVKMKYPRETSEGPGEHHVMVPLLSVAPMSAIRLDELTMELDLEVVEEDDDIKVGFPHQKRTLFGGEKSVDSAPNAKVTIKLTADDHSPGMQAVVEGYDKSLRAQIPS